jgi:hypothetical protein
MTIHITPPISKAYENYMNEAIDFDFNGTPTMRRSTYPYQMEPGAGMVDFAAGYQAFMNESTEKILSEYEYWQVEDPGWSGGISWFTNGGSRANPLRFSKEKDAIEYGLRRKLAFNQDTTFW